MVALMIMDAIVGVDTTTVPLVDGHEEINTQNFVDYTCFYTAYLRAVESAKPDALVGDEFAHVLAGDTGKQVALSIKSKQLEKSIDMLAIRTRYVDEFIAQRDPTIHQVVILAAGLDSRAYRLESLKNAQVFEVDRCKGLKRFKENVFKKQLNAKPIAKQVTVVEADVVVDPWDDLLVEAGLNTTKPTLWIVEGLLYYLTKDAILNVLQQIDQLSATNSALWTDMCGQAVLEDCSGGFTSMMSYGEDDFTSGVLSSIQWDLQCQANLSSESTHFGRLWQPIHFQTKDQALQDLPWLFLTAKKPSTSVCPRSA